MAHALVNRHLGVSLQEMIMGVVHRVAALLRLRPEMITNQLRPGADESQDRNGLAQTVAREVTAVLSDLWECAERLEGSPPTLSEINQTVRQAIEIARESWEKRPRWQKGSLELTFEPSEEPLASEISTALVSVLVHTIDSAVESLPTGGQIRIRTARENGHILISIGETSTSSARDSREGRLRPLGLGLAVLRAFATRHGGEATLVRERTGRTTLLLRLPIARSLAQPALCD